MQCEIKKREEIIDDFVTGSLPEAERERFIKHAYGCGQCFEEMQFREALVEAIQTEEQKKSRRTARSYAAKIPKYAWPIAAVFLIIVLLQSQKPQFYDIAKLTETERREIAIGSRGLPTKQLKPLDRAAVSLLKAETTDYFLIPEFDAAQVDSAIHYFDLAYKRARHDIERNQIIYYLAKAYLMRNDKIRACQWLTKVNEDTAYSARAQKLHSKLTCATPEH